MSNKNPAGGGPTGQPDVSKNPDGSHPGMQCAASAGLTVRTPVPSINDPDAATAKQESTVPTTKPPKGDAGEKKKTNPERERRREEHKARNERVRLALWPTSEAVKSVLDKACEETLDYQRLFTSVRFREAWKTFEASKKPSGSDRTKLRTLAAQTLSRVKGSAHQNPSKRKPGSEGRTDNRNNSDSVQYGKRNRDVITPSPTLAAGRSLPKIPRKGESTLAAAASSTLPVAAAVTPSALGEVQIVDENVVEDESQYGPLSSFSDIEASLPGEDYASAAKGEKVVRNDCPHVVFVHRGRDLREKIDRPTWVLFRQKLSEKLVNDLLEGKDSPDIDWTGFKDGTGVIAPADEASQKVVLELIDGIEVAEYKFKGWPRGHADTKKIVTVKISPDFQKVPSGKLVQALAMKNKLELGSFYLFSARVLNQQNGERILKIVTDEDSFKAIKERKGYLRLGLQKIEVYYLHTRIE